MYKVNKFCYLLYISFLFLQLIYYSDEPKPE